VSFDHLLIKDKRQNKENTAETNLVNWLQTIEIMFCKVLKYEENKLREM